MASIIGTIRIPSGIPGSNLSVVKIISGIFTAAYAIAGIATVAFIIVGGLKMIMSAGDSDKIREGRDTLTNAIIGLVVVLVSGLIFQFIGKLLGVESLITWFDFKLK